MGGQTVPDYKEGDAGKLVGKIHENVEKMRLARDEFLSKYDPMFPYPIYLHTQYPQTHDVAILDTAERIVSKWAEEVRHAMSVEELDGHIYLSNGAAFLAAYALGRKDAVGMLKTHNPDDYYPDRRHQLPFSHPCEFDGFHGHPLLTQQYVAGFENEFYQLEERCWAEEKLRDSQIEGAMCPQGL